MYPGDDLDDGESRSDEKCRAAEMQVCVTRKVMRLALEGRDRKWQYLSPAKSSRARFLGNCELKSLLPNPLNFKDHMMLSLIGAHDSNCFHSPTSTCSKNAFTMLPLKMHKVPRS